MTITKQYKFTTNSFKHDLYHALVSAKSDFQKLNAESGNHVDYEKESGFIYDSAEKQHSYHKSITDTPIYSIIRAFLDIAKTGLTIDPQKQQAYLNVQHINANELVTTLGFQYRGYLTLANRSGAVALVQSDVIYTKDDFSFNGAREKVTHKVKALSPSLRGSFGGGYCTTELIDGSVITTIMAPEEMIAIEEQARMYEKSAWNGPFIDEMRRKTLIRRHWKTLARLIETMQQNQEKTVISTLVEIEEDEMKASDSQSVKNMQARY